MKDKLDKTWGYHVRPGQPFWRIRRLWWKLRYLYYRIAGLDERRLDPEWLKKQRKIRPP